jgi:CheY-like chemotaxis protein
MPITPTATGGTCRRVLIVEDNPDSRESLQRLIRMCGHEVAVAEDGPRGVSQALNWEPDIAIVDIGLPVFDGYEVARRIRESRGPRPRLIALTGYTGAEVRRRAFEAGFDEHLAKGTDLDHLLDMLGSA